MKKVTSSRVFTKHFICFYYTTSDTYSHSYVQYLIHQRIPITRRILLLNKYFWLNKKCLKINTFKTKLLFEIFLILKSCFCQN